MKCKFFVNLFLLGLLQTIIVTSNSFGQESEGGLPPSFSIEKKQRAKIAIPTYTTSSIPLTELQAQDVVLDQGKFPFRFGYNFNVSLDIKKEGALQVLPDGNNLWTYRIECPDAISINLLYSSFKLPDEAKLFLYNNDRTKILGAYTKNNNQETEKFGTETTPGETVTLEYLEPANPEFEGKVIIGVIVHGYRNHDSSLPQSLNSGSCNVNINCPEAAGWENQKRAVARILINGNTFCTGTLINNTRQDDKPYFITANHCIGDLDALSKPDASGWVFYWNYESSTCSGISGPQTQTTAGATIKANSTISDFALLELKSKPDASYHVFYSGWNRSNTPADGAVGIHHPAGDIKKFSRDNSTIQDDKSTHWKVPSWDIGVTEGGSSGSALFDMNKYFVGQLTGGASGCGAPASSMWDIYGKLSYSWDLTDTLPQRRLKDWLDPDNTEAITLNGKNPGSFINNPPTVAILSPLGNSKFVGPATITITAIAKDTDGIISKVEFYNGSIKLGEDLTAPYEFIWNNLATGNYQITARAIDNASASTFSSICNIIVSNPINLPPIVSIIVPTSNASFSSPATIIINANASDPDGTVIKVEFYSGDNKIGEDLTSPYNYTWAGIAEGNYTLRAHAIDNNGAITISSLINIIVTGVEDRCINIPQYAYGNKYEPGSVVKNAGRIYECKPWPYSGWCNIAEWAYGPGVGMYWTDAWIEVGSCTTSKSRNINSKAESNVLISPNPTENTISVNFNSQSLTEQSVQLYDALGNKVLDRNIISGSQIDLSDLSSGIYILKMIVEGEIIISRVVKK